MTKTLKDLLEHAETWPREDQDELAEYAREIQARRTGIYTMSDEERAAVARASLKPIKAGSYLTRLWRKPINATTDEGTLYPRGIRGPRANY